MIAPNVVLNAFLATNAALVVAVTRPAPASQTPQIYSPRLAPGWVPSNGPAVVLFIRGGPEPNLYTPIVKPSFQVTTWAATPKLARTIHSLVYEQLHGAPPQNVTTQDGDVQLMWGKAENFPQDVVDPETGWFTVTSHFEIAMRLAS